MMPPEAARSRLAFLLETAILEAEHLQHARWRYGFHDSLIVASALTAGCRTLLSEDLQHGQRVQGLTIVDPFRVS